MATHFEKKNQAIFQSALNLKPNSDHFEKNIFLSGHINAISKKYLHVYESQILVFDF